MKTAVGLGVVLHWELCGEKADIAAIGLMFDIRYPETENMIYLWQPQ